MEEFQGFVESIISSQMPDSQEIRIQISYKWKENIEITCFSTDNTLLANGTIIITSEETNRSKFESEMLSHLRLLSFLHLDVSFEAFDRFEFKILFKTEKCETFERRVMNVLGLRLRELFKVSFTEQDCDAEIFFFNNASADCNMLLCNMKNKGYFNPKATDELLMKVLVASDLFQDVGFIGSFSSENDRIVDKCVKQAAKIIKARLKAIQLEIDECNKTPDNEMMEKFFRLEIPEEPKPEVESENKGVENKRVLRKRKKVLEVDLTGESEATETKETNENEISDDFYYEFCCSDGFSIDDGEERTEEESLVCRPLDPDLLLEFLDKSKFYSKPEIEHEDEFTIDKTEFEKRFVATKRRMKFMQEKFDPENPYVPELERSSRRTIDLGFIADDPEECKKIEDRLYDRLKSKSYVPRSSLLNEKEVKKFFDTDTRPKKSLTQTKLSFSAAENDRNSILPKFSDSLKDYRIPKKSSLSQSSSKSEKSPVRYFSNSEIKGRPPIHDLDRLPEGRAKEMLKAAGLSRLAARALQVKAEESPKYLPRHVESFIDGNDGVQKDEKMEIIDIADDSDENSRESDANNNGDKKRKLYPKTPEVSKRFFKFKTKPARGPDFNFNDGGKR